MARRGDEAQPETLEVVKRVVERVDFELAAVAGAGVDLADGKAASKAAMRGAIEALRKLGEGMALIEAFRGECLTYVRLDAAGRVERAHQRDASWFHWPLLEGAVLGNIVADFPLCNKSFNGSYSGHDL